MKTEIREKLMCVLRNRIQDFEKSGHFVDTLSFEGIDYKQRYETNYKTVEITKVEKDSYFYQKVESIIKRKSKEVNKMYQVPDGGYWRAFVCYGGNSFLLTEEEYKEIEEIRRERIEKRQLEKLEELCK